MYILVYYILDFVSYYKYKQLVKNKIRKSHNMKIKNWENHKNGSINSDTYKILLYYSVCLNNILQYR